jgi:dienelactone hydrolase
VIGIWNNSQLIADQFAANGYYTLLIDEFDGDALTVNRPPGFDFPAWVGKHPPEKVDPIVEAGVKYLKDKGVKKIGAVGYCFGAKYVARFLNGRGVDAGYSAHPVSQPHPFPVILRIGLHMDHQSFVTEEELGAIKGPFSISAAETDAIFTVELRHKSEGIFKETKQPWQINLFSGVEHGFAVRGDPSVKHQKFAKEQAFLQAVHWFDEHLS